MAAEGTIPVPKVVQVEPATHYKLKQLALKERVTLRELVERLLVAGLAAERGR